MDEKILKALCDPTRYRLLQMLVEEGCCVQALACRCGLSESAVSQHLKILREADLVQGIKYGYYTHYKVNRDTLQKAIDAFAELTRSEGKKCAGTFRGCSVAQQVKCKNHGEKEGTEPQC